MELQDYLRVLRNHWVGVLVITILCGAVAMAWTMTRTPMYSANATGLVGTGASTGAGDASVGDTLAISRATSYVAVARGRETAQDVIDRLHLDTSPSALIGDISVTQPVNTVLLQITATATTPVGAQQLADAWVAALADEVKQIESPNTPLHDGVPRIVPVDQAALPSRPSSPDAERNIGLGVLLGLLLGFGYAVLRSTLDRRLRVAADVETRSNVPVVGVIPAAGVLKHASLATTAAADDLAATPVAEAFRKLRTNLMFMSVDNPPRAVVISSARPGDGKSTVATNIAAALESSGQEVVLIDADLRRPTVAGRFGVDEAVGVTNVLSGQVKLDDALQRAPGFERLSILAAGTEAPNPSELLGSQTMKNLIATLKESAFVILDAPPLLPVTDAALLSTAADGVLLVISSGRTLDTDLDSCVTSIQAVSGRVLGVVLNRTHIRESGRGYGYHYHAYHSRRDPSRTADVPRAE